MRSDDRIPPAGTGQSISRSGEDIAQDENEPGDQKTATSGAGRPAGGSSARASTGIDPQDPVDPQSPRLQTP